MKRITLFNGILFSLAMILVLASIALAAADYDLSWWTADGGGGINLSNSAYSLSGTIGQPDAGELSAGDYSLNGGYWAGIAPEYRLCLPLIKR
jgi:hypothetical protein